MTKRETTRFAVSNNTKFRQLFLYNNDFTETLSKRSVNTFNHIKKNVINRAWVTSQIKERSELEKNNSGKSDKEIGVILENHDKKVYGRFEEIHADISYKRNLKTAKTDTMDYNDTLDRKLLNRKVRALMTRLKNIIKSVTKPRRN